jgi:hypothetical protein
VLLKCIFRSYVPKLQTHKTHKYILRNKLGSLSKVGLSVFLF